MQKSVSKICSVSDLRDLSLKLDEHVKVPAYMKQGKEFEDVKKFKWVWNVQKEHIANSVSAGYQIIQHRDIFRTVSDALDNLKLEVEGRFDDFGDFARTDLVFSKKKMIDDKEKGIKLGIRVKNSNNKKSSFSLEMFAFRMICQNGMTIGDTIPGIKMIQVHYGKDPIELKDVERMTQLFVKKVINSSSQLQTLVNETMKDSIEWKILEKIMPKLIKAKKYMKKICTELGIDVIEVVDKKTKKVNTVYEFNGKVNRWDLYNAITSVISHDEQLKVTSEASLEFASRTVLKQKYEKLIEVYK